jgi:hypothetical protein
MCAYVALLKIRLREGLDTLNVFEEHGEVAKGRLLGDHLESDLA